MENEITSTFVPGAVSGTYGAPMGRASEVSALAGEALTARPLAMDNEDPAYDSGGAYWGLRPRGRILWAVLDESGCVVAYRDGPDPECFSDVGSDVTPGELAARVVLADLWRETGWGERPGYFVDDFDPTNVDAVMGWLREGFDDYDSYASGMSILFDLAGELERRGEDVPSELGYRPGAGGPGVSDGMAEGLAMCGTEALQRAALIWNRYCDRIRATESY